MESSQRSQFGETQIVQEAPVVQFDMKFMLPLVMFGLVHSIVQLVPISYFFGVYRQLDDESQGIPVDDYCDKINIAYLLNAVLFVFSCISVVPNVSPQLERAVAEENVGEVLPEMLAVVFGWFAIPICALILCLHKQDVLSTLEPGLTGALRAKGEDIFLAMMIINSVFFAMRACSRLAGISPKVVIGFLRQNMTRQNQGNDPERGNLNSEMTPLGNNQHDEQYGTVLQPRSFG